MITTISEFQKLELSERPEISTPGIRMPAIGFEGSPDAPVAENDGTFQLKIVQFVKSHQGGDAELAALMSEEALAKIWNTAEEDEAWRNL